MQPQFVTGEVARKRHLQTAVGDQATHGRRGLSYAAGMHALSPKAQPSYAEQRDALAPVQAKAGGPSPEGVKGPLFKEGAGTCQALKIWPKSKDPAQMRAHYVALMTRYGLKLSSEVPTLIGIRGLAPGATRAENPKVARKSAKGKGKHAHGDTFILIMPERDDQAPAKGEKQPDQAPASQWAGSTTPYQRGTSLDGAPDVNGDRKAVGRPFSIKKGSRYIDPDTGRRVKATETTCDDPKTGEAQTSTVYGQKNRSNRPRYGDVGTVRSTNNDYEKRYLLRLGTMNDKKRTKGLRLSMANTGPEGWNMSDHDKDHPEGKPGVTPVWRDTLKKGQVGHRVG